MTPVTRRRTLLAALLLAGAATAAFAGTASGRAPDAPGIEWERAEPVGPQADSLLVRVRWSQACDLLGCADSYRITWTYAITPAAFNTPLPGSPQSRLPQPTVVDGVPVVRDATIRTTRDSVRVVSPAFPATGRVCVSIVALRRTLASSARTSCRTIERPDMAPPPVDSIRWDSLGVETDTARVYPRLIDSTFFLDVSEYQFRPTFSEGADSATVTDSLPVQWLPTANGALDAHLNVGYMAFICPTVLDKDGTAWVIIPRAAVPWDYRMIRGFMDRCSRAHTVLETGRAPRFLLDRIGYGTTPDYDRDSTPTLRTRHYLAMVTAEPLDADVNAARLRQPPRRSPFARSDE